MVICHTARLSVVLYMHHANIIAYHYVSIYAWQGFVSLCLLCNNNQPPHY